MQIRFLMILKAFSVAAFLGILGAQPSFAQNVGELKADTLRLGLDSAENIFVRQNLSLLAQRYNVNANEAWRNLTV